MLLFYLHIILWLFKVTFHGSAREMFLVSKI